MIDQAIPYIKGVFEPFCRVVYADGRSIGPDEVADADALIVRTRTRCDAALLEDSKVQVIATATVGFDHIDMRWCRKAGIAVFPASGANARGVLQWVAAVLASDSTQQGWEPGGRTLGVVGTGNVGSLSAVYGQLWGFRVLCCDPPRERKKRPSPSAEGYVDLETIARESDIITFHTPLTNRGEDATYHLAGKEFFSALKPGTLVLNSSRGEVADTREFSRAIRSGICRGAVDTWENEPDIDTDFLELTKLGTPHIAGYTEQGKANASAMAVNCVASFFGLPLIGWYPPQVSRIVPRKIGWDEMKATIRDYFDIQAEDARLRSEPAAFEALRNSYVYRREYF